MCRTLNLLDKYPSTASLPRTVRLSDLTLPLQPSEVITFHSLRKLVPQRYLKPCWPSADRSHAIEALGQDELPTSSLQNLGNDFAGHGVRLKNGIFKVGVRGECLDKRGSDPGWIYDARKSFLAGRTSVGGGGGWRGAARVGGGGTYVVLTLGAL